MQIFSRNSAVAIWLGRVAAKWSAATATPLGWRISPKLMWGLMILGLIGLAPIVPVNHDESQYLAAAALTRSGLPFVDFLHLQTPLQSFVTAPIAALSGGYSYIVLRIATAIAALATLWLVFRCQRRLGVDERTAICTTALLSLTYSFQFGATLVRNDMMPALLLTIGLLAAIAAIDGRRSASLWAIVGLAFSAAVGTKLSYAVPAAAVGLFHLVTVVQCRRRRSLIDASACALGALVGMVPVAIIFAQAPAAFIYGVLDYGAEAPFQWYRSIGLDYRLGFDWKLLDTAIVLLRGPACVALAVVASTLFKRGKRAGSHLLLDLLVVAGVIAALLPTPTWRQYLIPLLPILFVRLGLAWEEGAVAGRWRRKVIAAFCLTAIIGLVQPVLWASRIVAGKNNPIRMTREAHWIGARLRVAGAQGAVATLSPHAVVDSGFALDPRFANGPFAYRSGDLLSDDEQRALHTVSPRTLDRFLAERPPGAIVTGYEGSELISLDHGLRSFAVDNGYRLERSPFGGAELFVRPRH